MQRPTKSLMVAVLLIGIFALGYFGVYGQWGKNGEAKAQRDLSQTDHDNLAKALSDMNGFIAKYDSNKEKASLITRALPVGDDDVPQILDGIADIATQTGMTIKQISVLPDTQAKDTPRPKNSIQSVDYEVQVRGTYEAYKAFTMRMENHLRLFDVLTVNIDSPDEEDIQDILNYTLTLRTYYQK